MTLPPESGDGTQSRRDELSVRLSDLATEAVAEATARYRLRLIARARSLSHRDEVDLTQVTAAERELRPYVSSPAALMQDWLKRIGLALLAACVPGLVIEMNSSARELETLLLIGGIGVGGILTTWALVADFRSGKAIAQERRIHGK
jgi:hypothetical protein